MLISNTLPEYINSSMYIFQTFGRNNFRFVLNSKELQEEYRAVHTFFTQLPLTLTSYLTMLYLFTKPKELTLAKHH